nr:hypothetical protein Iba_chr12aCG12340 [Ipomoea batatas]GMD68683.1 hypothetical protein Iba_chr12dCG11570 [Ipomoea batatas]GME05644.1 hypothetical protein Iba_scaffold3049CG1790 [Ipomoea batatas]
MDKPDHNLGPLLRHGQQQQLSQQVGLCKEQLIGGEHPRPQRLSDGAQKSYGSMNSVCPTLSIQASKQAYQEALRDQSHQPLRWSTGGSDSSVQNL